MAASDNLASRTGRSMLWTGIETFGMAAVSLIISVVLARLVEPTAFGLIAMTQIFIAVGQVFADSGISRALIRLPRRSRSLDSAALVISIALALVCYALLWCCAPGIADFYEQPELIDVIRQTGLTILLAGACVVQTARLSSQMRFKQLAGVTVSSSVVSGVCGVITVYLGYGIAALIVQQLSMWGTRTLLLWVMFPWRPCFKFRLSEVRSLCAFSWKLLLSALIDTIYVNMYAPIIGKFFFASVTAMYWRAYTLAAFIPQGLHSVVDRVSLPVISKIRDDRQRTARAYMSLLRCCAWLMSPICAIGIALAEPLFRWLLTDKWLPAVPIFQILAVVLALYPIHALNCTALNVYGRSDKFLYLEICKKVIGVATLCITLPRGVTPLCWGLLIAGVINLTINIRFARPYVGLGIVGQLRLILPNILSAIPAGAAAYFTSQCADLLWQKVIFGALAGAVTYFLITYITRNPALRDILYFCKLRRSSIPAHGNNCLKHGRL